MDLFAKLELLTDSAKYDVACTSSGVDRTAKRGQKMCIRDRFPAVDIPRRFFPILPFVYDPAVA